ncbi:MAG TPA: tRNA 2-thiocytidine(32) synthetase TtcA [Holophagaceae bacterium]|nr:tRNA 2-thiocytidine(32) synthetase TtcA [Holophagaceae bacterium]
MSSPCALPTLAQPPTEADLAGLPKLEKRILRRVGEVIRDYKLIEDGDRILVGLSGGKDSWALLEVLELLRRRAPVSFEVHGVTVDPGFPKFDPDRIAEVCEAKGIPHHVLSAPIDALIRQRPEATPCIICSRLRRGVLYTFAKERGFTKIALGHHLDDLLETLLLNLFFEGKLGTMPLRLTSDDGANTVIRPLGTCEESDLQRYTWLKGYPIVPCGCPMCACSELESRRKQAKALIGQLRGSIPAIKSSMLHALQNVKPTHLLDLKLGAVDAVGVDEAVERLG